MKKRIALISALTLLLSLCACSGQAVVEESEGLFPEPGAASQSVLGDLSQDPKSDEAPTPLGVEANAPESGEDAQPSSAPETSEPTPGPASGPAVPPATKPDQNSASNPKPGSGQESKPAPGSGPAQEPTPPSGSESAPPPPSTPEPPPAADPKEVAQNLIGHPVSELYAAIGKPVSTDYAPGCIEPDSEDGELIYSGFTVYTVRTATREYIYDVL